MHYIFNHKWFVEVLMLLGVIGEVMVHVVR